MPPVWYQVVCKLSEDDEQKHMREHAPLGWSLGRAHYESTTLDLQVVTDAPRQHALNEAIRAMITGHLQLCEMERAMRDHITTQHDEPEGFSYRFRIRYSMPLESLVLSLDARRA